MVSWPNPCRSRTDRRSSKIWRMSQPSCMTITALAGSRSWTTPIASQASIPTLETTLNTKVPQGKTGLLSKRTDSIVDQFRWTAVVPRPSLSWASATCTFIRTESSIMARVTILKSTNRWVSASRCVIISIRPKPKSTASKSKPRWSALASNRNQCVTHSIRGVHRCYMQTSLITIWTSLRWHGSRHQVWWRIIRMSRGGVCALGTGILGRMCWSIILSCPLSKSRFHHPTTQWLRR